MGRQQRNFFGRNSGNSGWCTCVRCGRKFRKGDVEIDHILPRNSGDDRDQNLQCLCANCSRSE
ncbi:MAG: HNH endonuclease [Clostridiales bacterium]|nr:HNH endonuclease [Clostridiales bacterium]